ncbi:F-box/LRR-repeat protein 7 [Halotydeus destructor]|nr:F-box/LRR-repeat protein 7 [Halotydeus destructor]
MELTELKKLSLSSSGNTTDQGYNTLVSSFTSNDMPSTKSLGKSRRQLPVDSLTRVRTMAGDMAGHPGGHTGVNKLKKKARKTCNSFDKLSDQLILTIFSYLKCDQLCSSCPRVSRRWYYLTWDPFLWNSIVFSECNLNLDKCLRTIFKLLSRDVYCRQRPSLLPADHHNDQDTGLTLRSNGSGNPVPLAVTSVRVDNSFTLTDRSLMLIARRCSELSVLQLRSCPNVSDLGLSEIMARCSELRRLELTGCANVTLSTTCSVQREPNQLNYVDVTDCHQVDDHSLKKFVKYHGSRLEQFYSRRCSLLTDYAIQTLVTYCPNLRELSLNDCPQLTDYSCFELSSKLGSSLRYLSMAKCEQITDSGIRQLGRFCYKLRYLNVRGCESVTDEGLACLARSCGPRLKALDCGKCDITDAGLKVISENCPNLRKLGLRDCDLISDTGLSLIAFYCRLLSHMNIADCPYITQDGYRYVKRYCRRCIIQHTNASFH